MSRGGDWIHPATRMAIVWFRDGGRCLACSFRPEERYSSGLTLDHVVPECLWGDAREASPHDPSNLATLCVRCQGVKGLRTPKAAFGPCVARLVAEHQARPLTEWHRRRGYFAAIRVGRYRREANVRKCRSYRAELAYQREERAGIRVAG